MYSKIFIMFLFFSLSSIAFYPQNINPNIVSFFNSLINDSTNLSQYVDGNELERSYRLGINYNGVKNKFLISYDISQDLKQKIREGVYPYKLDETNLGNGIQKISFVVEKLNYFKDFYFKNTKLISPISYFTSGWKKLSSKHFDFYISDSSTFNNYAVLYLEKYIDVMINLLDLNSKERGLLEKKKIIYILCKDNEEIKKVTGFDTRGIYILAADEIVTTYNCHLHELSHLLINYKLKTLPLYTLSFFQEGFAVATGGRGGISRDILLDSGYYLQKSGFVPFNSIITQNEFHSENASVTYPVSGIYSFYLLHEYGLGFYLDTYRKYSGNEEYVKKIKVDSVMLPSISKFEAFIKNYKIRSGIELNHSAGTQRVIYEGQTGKILKIDSVYQFSIRQNLLLSDTEPLKGYRSNKFKELFPDINYNGEKYLLTVNKTEINIYNLYTNILMDSYSRGLSFENKDVPVIDGYFTFYVNEKLFDKDLSDMKISGF